MTEKGPVVTWVERIAQIARAAGVEMHSVNWLGSPSEVAYSVYTALEPYDKPRMPKIVS